MTPDELVASMDENGWSVGQLAKVTGYTPRSIKRYRAGERAIPLTFVKSMRMATRLTVREERRKRRKALELPDREPRLREDPFAAAVGQ